MAKLEVFGKNIILERSDGTKIDLSYLDEVGQLCWGYFWYRLNGKYGYIDEEGNTICNPIYDSASNFDYGMHGRVSINNKYGFINRTGDEICHMIYDKAWWFNNGFAKVERDGATYYIDNIGIEYQTTYVEKIWRKKRERYISQ